MVTRKQFLKRSLSAAADLAASLAESGLARLPVGRDAGTLSPPGAVSRFHDACSSCGDCVGACPENAIVMQPDRLTDKSLPVIIPASKACAMCRDLPCVSACGDGALKASGAAGYPVEFPAIGIASVQTKSCLAHNGSACMTCYDACPLKRQALLFKMNRPVVDAAACTGCGQCEFVCPTEKKGIVVTTV